MKKGDLLWGLGIVLAAAVLIVPASKAAFVELTGAHPYLMGFIKFAILAIMGELLAIRIIAGDWVIPSALGIRSAIWGLLGMAITLVFAIAPAGISGVMAKGLLPGGDSTLLWALYVGTFLNVSFGPVMMALHRMTDTYLDMRAEGLKPAVADVARRVDWASFYSFVIIKTVPLFWIPAHTITFLLPPEYRVITAAFLSVALGGILAFAKKRPAVQPA